MAELSRRQLMAAGAALTSACLRDDAAARGRQQTELWFTYGGKNREVLQSLVERYHQGQTRDWVHTVFQGDYFEGLAKLRVALAAKAAPALSHVVGEVIPYLARAGVLEPLEAYPAARELDIVPALGQAGSWLGGGERPLVALPFNRSTPIAYINADKFGAAALDAPRTWEELRQTALALTRRVGSRTETYGFGCPVDWWFWVALVQQAGGNVVERDGRVSLGDEAGVAALELWQTLVNQDRSMKPPPGRDYNAWEQTNQDFLAGRVAMIWTSTAFLKYLEENARFRVVAAPLPAGLRRAVPTGGTHWVILKSAPADRKTAAYRFLQFVLETEQVIHWATRTGYIPVTQSAIASLQTSGHYTRHPNDQVTVEQLRFAVPWPWSPSLFRVQREIVQPRLESAVLSAGNARALLADAQRLASLSR
ncbi:MAG TPA: ABC transporter substrate-binding protein [Polyangiaceae bacterium]|nr:ABC transporter substrate-binding protein [Polyangiaceae bacterium]